MTRWTRDAAPRLLAAACMLTAKMASAQAAPVETPIPPPAGPAAPEVTPALPAALAPAPPTPEPPKTPLEIATDTASSLVRFYGTFKPTAIVSAGALESFSQPNASAETAAGNPALATLPGQTRGTLQVAQSRVGLFVAEKSVARGQLEIDFVDFTKASPTVAALPRLRILKVEWEPVKRLVLGFGQDWDLYGPLNPYGSNLVGASFLAGNTGFMRQQIKVVYTAGNVVELGAAVGLQAPNATAKDANVEIGHMPTAAVRAALIIGKSRIGISGIASQVRIALNTPAERDAGAYSGMVYADLEPVQALHIKAEGYVARNLANLGALALSQATSASGDLEEVGGFVSARAAFTPEHAVFVTGGVAQVLNPSHVVPSYAYVANVATLSGTGPGMRFNVSARVGYEWRPVKPLALLFEGFVYRSRHTLQAADEGRFSSLRTAPGLELAALYTF